MFKFVLLIVFCYVYISVNYVNGEASCSSGYYYDSCKDLCVHCPTGYYCEDGETHLPCPKGTFLDLVGGESQGDCKPCLAGYYADQEGSTTCRPCPAGYTCSDSTLSPVKCPLGTFASSLATSGSCTSCPEGFYCPPSGDKRIPCPAGEYSDEPNSVQCKRCDPGTYAKQSGSTSCTPCPAGSKCSVAFFGPVSCPLGTYSPQGSEACIFCPKGHSCEDPSESPAECPEGTFSIGGIVAQRCTECPTGTYAPDTASSACIPCPVGHKCTGKKTSSSCPANYYSPRFHDDCELCPPGTSVNGDQSGCTSCPAGSRCPLGSPAEPCPPGFVSKINATECQSCLPGTKPNAQQSGCESCGPGVKCPNPSSGEQDCPEGYFSAGNSGLCIKVPRGAFSATPAALPVNCPPGTYSSDGTSCEPCPPGRSCAVPSALPQLCLDGEYSAGGDVFCTSCPAGFQCDDISAVAASCNAGYYSPLGDSSCHECPPGLYCPSNTTDSLPLLCPEGFYSLGGQVECTECPAGSYCPNPASSPIPCPDGTYSSPGKQQCQMCREGFYCQEKVADHNEAPQIRCPAGTFSTVGQSECSACPAGMACPDRKEFKPVICSRGHYSPVGSITCLVCPAGHECSDPKVDPVPCQPGTFSYAGAARCTLCPPGHSCQNPAVSPVLCPQGTYSLIGNPNPACSPCSPGYRCVPGSTTPTPKAGLCPLGSYCDGSSSQQCPAGWYGILPGQATLELGCARCPAGRFCQIGTMGICPRGHYCPSQTTYDSEFPCPQGTYNNDEGAMALSECKVCPKGYYCGIGTSDYQQFPCARGWYCPEGTGSPGSTHGPIRCPIGTYNRAFGGSSLDNCLPCPPGHRCNSVNHDNCGRLFNRHGYTCPHACPGGTYQPKYFSSHENDCIPCPAGYACPAGSVNPKQHQCYPGYFCETGTSCSGNNCIPPAGNRCPAGTYTTSYHLTKIDDCSICWEGYSCGNIPVGCEPGQSCPAGTSSMTICSPGHYCPGVPWNLNGTNPYTLGSYVGDYSRNPTQYHCPPGTYGPESGLKSASDCSTCPAGSFCEGGGADVDGPCPNGYFCPKGTKFENEYPCPAGTYNNETGLTTAFDCKPCPTGKYCTLGTIDPFSCPSGTYNNLTFAVKMLPDSDRLSLGLVDDDISCVTCPGGYFCPESSSVPIVCPPGKYSDVGANTCETCPAGRFCPTNGTTYQETNERYLCEAGIFCPDGLIREPPMLDFPCPAGKYCPKGSPEPIDCPAGSYNPHTGVKRVEDCLPCPRGRYCEQGSVEITGSCAAGYFCPENSTTRYANPCPERFYRDMEGAFALSHCSVCINGHYCPEGTANPIICPQGYYCIRGVVYPEPCPIGTYGKQPGLKRIEDCTDCDNGKFCETLGQTEPSGPCDAGYFCSRKSYTAAPQDPSIGGLCPRGGFCPEGSSGPSPCQPGTFNNFLGGKTQADCAPCTPGFYCAGSSNPFPTGPCMPGYFCVSDETDQATNAFQYPTNPGYYSVEGSQNEIPCPAGTWTNIPSTPNECFPCPPGRYCKDVGMSNQNQYTCPAGSFCPEGSVFPTGCPPGTIGEGAGFMNSTQCTAIVPGYFGQGERLTEPTGECFAGYLCFESSLRPNPVGEPYGDVCPAGHFCGQGALEPTPCNPGTYSPHTRNPNVDLCFPCAAGQYCGGSGLTQPSGDCAAGHYCPAGNNFDNPTAGPVCPEEYYCPIGTPTPIPCADGNRTTATGQTTCHFCPPGIYCRKSSVEAPCPSGHYCPEGTGIVQPKCPPGTFRNSEDGVSLESCQLCTAGRICTGWGLTSPDGDCIAGSYCASGASDVEGTPGVRGGDSGICPPGFYCEAGTTEPEACPLGTYGSIDGLHAESECQPCLPGYYCPEQGLNVSTMYQCDEGYFCSESSDISNPTDGVLGNICPVGHYCPEGTAHPVPCPEGTFQDETTKSICKDCPIGFYCTGTTQNPVVCPEGRFCPEGTGHEIPKCPPGSYSNAVQNEKMEDCTICDGGKFCSKHGLVSPDGDCKAGIQCTNGASDENGTPGILGGSSGICPRGHYCEAGTIFPEPCPESTFANWTGNLNVSQCSPCSPGFYCPGSANGVSDPTQYPCSEGYFCVLGATVPNPTDGVSGDICPTGFFCPEASRKPRPCPLGYFNPSLNATECLLCPEGYYCPEGNMTEPYVCPLGYYCPDGTAASLPKCPPGSFGGEEGLKSQLDCTPCLPGEYCGNYGLVEPNGNCSQGYFCVNGSATVEGITGILGGETGICPRGHYCVEKSFEPKKCPRGTFNPFRKQPSSKSCIRCTPGFFCPKEGEFEVVEECNGGYYCPGGQFEKEPEMYICPAGFKCPNGTILPIGCQDGKYQPDIGQVECLDCPAGSYCVSNATEPILCPSRMYCAAASGYPRICAPGTYNDQTGRVSQNDCISCPAGKYCSNGAITGDCHAGHICLSGNPTATPVSGGGGFNGQQTGGLCQPGFYCPEGTTQMIPCPSGTFGVLSGARDSSVCGPCPAGYFCSGSSNLAEDCPRGKYCVAVTGVPEDCPKGTYNPLVRGTNLTSCLPCPQGYYCPNEGQENFASFICPPGHFCPEGVNEPSKCPAGTYKPDTGGTSISSCLECPSKRYCPEKTITPVSCPSGSFCVSGSQKPEPCPSKYYCPFETDDPLVCPAGRFCAEAVSTPTLCPSDSYCPSLTDIPIPCPYGYRTLLSNLQSRTTLQNSCEICPPGTFGNSTGQIQCQPCIAGHVCLEGATNDRPTNRTLHRGYLCPRGSYCPAESGQEIQCPVGTYMHLQGADGTTKTCIPCEPGSYNDRVGRPECRRCGSSAWSEAGATTCICRGRNRGYQSDGSCRCLRGFVYFNSDNERVTADSTADCTREVFARCGTGQTHDRNGRCVTSNNACSDLCADGGLFLPTFGLCQCLNQPSNTDEICDSSCRNQANRLRFRGQGIRKVQGNGNQVDYLPSEIVGDTNQECPEEGCNLSVIRILAEQGFFGLPAPSNAYIHNLLNTTNSEVNKRFIRQIQEEIGVNNPIVCLESGSGLLWDLSSSDGSYPVYGDSLLNSEENFDSGTFRELRNLMRSNLNVNLFVSFFNTPGQYVFESSDSNANYIILKVLPDGETCPNDATFYPVSESHLAEVGIVPISNVALTPDWNLAGVLMLGTFALAGSIFFCINYFRQRLWIDRKQVSGKKKLTAFAKLLGEKVKEDNERTFDFDVCFQELGDHENEIQNDMEENFMNFESKFEELLQEVSTIKSLVDRKVQSNSSIVIDVRYTIEKLKTVNNAADVHKIFKEVKHQIQELLSQGDETYDYANSTLEPHLLKEMKILEKQASKQRKELVDCYRIHFKTLDKLADQVNQLQLEVSDEEVYKEQLEPLLQKFNQTLEDLKKKLPQMLKHLNDTLNSRNQIQRQETKTYELKLDTSSYSALKDFLKQHVTEMFEKYKLANADDEEDNEDYVFDEDELDASDDGIEEKVDASKSAEQRVSDHQKLRKKNLMLQQRSENAELENDFEFELKKAEDKIQNEYNEMRDKAVELLHKQTMDKINSNPDMSPAEKNRLMKNFRMKANHMKQSVEALKKRQLSEFEEQLQKKKDKRINLMEKKQEAERNRFIKEQKEEKQVLKRVVHDLLQDPNNMKAGISIELLKQKEVLKHKLEMKEKIREKRQKHERQLVEELLDGEDKLDLRLFRETTKLMNKDLVAGKAKLLSEIALNFQGSEDEKVKLLKEHESIISSYKKALDNRKLQAEEDLKERLKHRRIRVQRDLEAKFKEVERKDIVEQERDLSALKILMEKTNLANENIDASRAREKVKQTQALEQRIQEMADSLAEKKIKWQTEQKKLEEGIENEKKEEIHKLNVKFEKDSKIKIYEKENELKSKLSAPDVDSNKREQLLATHRLELQDYEQKMGKVKQSQSDSIEKRLQEKLEELKNKKKAEQDAELLKALKLQESQLDQHKKSSMEEIEAISIDLGLKAQQDLDKLKDVHQRSLDDFEKKKENEVNQTLSDYKNSLTSEYDKKKNALDKTYEKRLYALKSKMEADIASAEKDQKERILSEYENMRAQQLEKQENERRHLDLDLETRIAERRKKLQKKVDKEIKKQKKTFSAAETKAMEKAQLDAEKKKILDLLMDENEVIHSIDDAVNRVIYKRHLKEIDDLLEAQNRQKEKGTYTPEMILQQTQDRVDLKQKQIDEKNQFLKEFEKYQDLIMKGNSETREIESELAAFAEKIQKQKEENIKKIREEKERMKKQMEQEIQEAKEQAEKERAAMLKRLNQQKNKLEIKQMMKEREEEIKHVIDKQKNMEQSERERLLEQHKLSMRQFESALEIERQRQNRILKKRIDQYEREIEKEKEYKLKAAIQEQYVDTEKMKFLQESTKEKEQQKNKTIRQAQATRSLMDQLDVRGARKMAKGGKIVHINQIIKERPYIGTILDRLKRVEDLLDMAYPPYVDGKEDSIKNEGELIPVQPEALNVTRLVAYRFGDFIIALLRSKFGFPQKITLAVASSLPPSIYSHNAFRNSFYYDIKDSVLYIRDSRLDRIGKFIVLVVHCVAHITAGELASDLKPSFIQNYYSMFQVVFEDLFNTRCRHSQVNADKLRNLTKDRIAKAMFNFSMNPLDHKDILSRIKIIPGKSDLEFSMAAKAIQAKRQARSMEKKGDAIEDLKSQQKDDKSSLMAHLSELQSEFKNNLVYFKTQKKNVEKVTAALSKLQDALSKNPSDKKLSTKVTMLQKQLQESRQKAITYKKVAEDIRKKISDTQSKLK